MNSTTNEIPVLEMQFNKAAKLEVKVHNWVEVSPEIFRSWSGPRKIDDQEYTGPVYLYLTNIKN